MTEPSKHAKAAAQNIVGEVIPKDKDEQQQADVVRRVLLYSMADVIDRFAIAPALAEAEARVRDEVELEIARCNCPYCGRGMWPKLNQLGRWMHDVAGDSDVLCRSDYIWTIRHQRAQREAKEQG